MSVSRDTVPTSLVDPDPEQPRQHFDPDALEELAASVRENGLVAPILVRPIGDRYVIVHGERRWRAVRQLGWSEIPAVVRELDDGAVRWLQLAENLNRDDLSPIEEARAYRALLDTGETQKSLAARLGKTRTYVAQKLRLLDLPAYLVLLCERRHLSEGHVRQLLRIRGLYTDAHSFGAAADAAEVDESLAAAVSGLLVACRPEDWPPGYPGIVAVAEKHPVLAEASVAWSREICQALATGRRYPYWTVPAFYFAALTVAAAVSVAALDKLLDAWIERIHSALLYTRDVHGEGQGLFGPVPPPYDREITGKQYLLHFKMHCLLWHEHRSDLRHAGLDVDNEHIDFFAALEGGFRDGSMALPSQCQPGGRRHEEYAELAARADDWG